MIRYDFSALLGALLFMGGLLSASELELVRNGQPVAVIELAEDAAPPERYAAEELQRAFRLMSGAELPIRTKGEEKGNLIQIGQLPKGLEGERISVQRTGSTLHLRGNSPREALYATYMFLHETLGARWYWPGETGEFIPRKSTISVGDLKLEHTPSLPFRSIGITSVSHGYDRDTDIWMVRNGMNLQSISSKTPERIIRERKDRGLMLRLAGHNVKLPQDVLERNPEYAALFAGERRTDTRVPPQLCWSNPKVVELVAEEIGRWWEILGVDFAAPYSADNTHFCECSECVAMGDVSTRWQKFSLQVMEKLEAKYPGRKYMTLAYQAYRNLPSGPIAPYVNNGYCIYNGCYRHTYDDPCEANPTALNELLEWQKLGGKMGIRGYEMIMFREAMFVPLVGFMVDQAQWAKKHGLESISTESPPYGFPSDKQPEEQRWASNRISYYATARAMWDASITREGIVTDWHHTIYGPAAEQMIEYYNAMEQAWRKTAGHITYFLNPAATYSNGFIDEQLVAQAERLFEQAHMAVGALADADVRARIAAEITFEQKLFNRWKALFLIQQGRQDRMIASAVFVNASPEVKAQQNEAIWATAPPFPAFEDKDGNLVKEQTEVRALWDKEALYLRFICQRASPEPLKALFQKRDAAVYGDDSIELFFNPDPSLPAYVHLAVNSLAAIWDARSEAGMNLDKKWDGDWLVATAIHPESWILDIKIPFASFGITPKESAELSMNFTRNRPGRLPAFPPSGWPDSSVHNPSGYGTIRLLKEAHSPIVLATNGGESLLASMHHQKLRAIRVTEENELSELLEKEAPSGLIIRYPWVKGTALSPSFLRENLLHYIQQGGNLLVITKGNLPLHEWFPQEDLAVQWSTEGHHPVRSAIYSPGEWSRQPNDLKYIFERGTTPRYGLRPLSPGWEVLARYRLSNNAEIPFLLRKPLGKGHLILTSSAFGFGGRHEIFGEGNSSNAAMLLENLFRK